MPLPAYATSLLVKYLIKEDIGRKNVKKEDDMKENTKMQRRTFLRTVALVSCHISNVG